MLLCFFTKNLEICGQILQKSIRFMYCLSYYFKAAQWFKIYNKKFNIKINDFIKYLIHLIKSIPSMFSKSQKQNFPFLQHIISNINYNPLMCKLADSIQSSGNLSGSLDVSSLVIDSCSKHTDKKGEFYETEYPWVKYCQSCALNLALCGKKIEKSLSSQQMLNKIKLCDILQSMSESIKSSQKCHNQYSFLSQQIQQSRQWFSSVVGQIDKFISQMTQIRNCLQQNIQITLNNEIKNLLEKESSLIAKKIQLISEKSRIQCGFVDLIDKEHETESLAAIQKGIRLMKEAQEMMITQSYKQSMAGNFANLERLFEEKIEQIKFLQMKVNFFQSKVDQSKKQLRLQNNFSKKALNFQKSKTQQTQQDNFSHQHLNRIFTALSTIRNSGLVSPFCESNSERAQPLVQSSQNKKNTRGNLQLKSRCRSKSGQRRVEINVRENIENAAKKKIA